MKKNFKAFLALVMVLIMLASCGSSGADTAPATGTDAPSATDDGGTDETADTQAPSGDKITLTWPCIWVGTDSKAAAVKAIVDEFNAANEGKIEVVIEESSDYQAYRDKLRTLIATGNAPDIFTFDSDIDVMLTSDKVADITSYMDDTWKDTFQKDSLENGSVDGKIKALPFEMGVTPVFYNMKLLKEAGWDKAPETYDELIQCAKDLKANGIDPFSQMTGENAWTSMLWYSQLLVACGGKDVMSNPDDPAWVEAADLMKELFEYTTADAVGAGASVSGGHYLAEETAIYMNGPWYIGRLSTDGVDGLYDNTEVAAAPTVEGGKGEAGYYVGSVQAFLAVGDSGDQAKTDAAVEFYKFFTQPENVARIAEDSGALFYIDSGDGGERIRGKMLEDIAAAPYVVNHLNYSSPPAVNTEFPQALSSLVLGECTSQEFVDMLNAQR